MVVGLMIVVGPATPARPGTANPADGPQPGGQRLAGPFRWPLDGTPRPVRRFDPPPRPWLPGHRGVDLAATTGTHVRAAGTGTVFFAGRIAGRGVVSIVHGNGLRTTYEPVLSSVAAGGAVRAGDPIGTLEAGHPGCPAEACLHWGLRRGDDYLDPLALLGLGRVRLLPLRAARPGPGRPVAARQVVGWQGCRPAGRRTVGRRRVGQRPVGQRPARKAGSCRASRSNSSARL
ncbi:murein hydrolase activator EnvC family protein [Polymorphospora rubra]|uniref:murein hydrolase activator EnvC family protein n=1 Tax=Polymorphospora rubra TaxID=338584 RepID=UPI003F4D3325